MTAPRTNWDPRSELAKNHHDAYHTSGLMDRNCQSCTEILRPAPAPVAGQDHYTSRRGKL